MVVIIVNGSLACAMLVSDEPLYTKLDWLISIVEKEVLQRGATF